MGACCGLRHWMGAEGEEEDVGTYAEDGQEDVNQEVGTTPALEEDAERREDDGKDDLADVAGGRQ